MNIFRLLSNVRSCRHFPYQTISRQCSKDAKNQKTFTKKGTVLGVFEKDGAYKLTEAAQECDNKCEGRLCAHLDNLGCDLKLGMACILTEPATGGTVALSCLGPHDAGFDQLEQLDQCRENIRCGIGAGVRKLCEENCSDLCVDPTHEPDAAAEAACLAAWKFDEYKCEGSGSARVTPLGESAEWASGSARVTPLGESAEWASGDCLSCCQNWARYLCQMPPNNMTPVSFAQVVLDTLCPLGVQVEARNLDWIKSQNMQAFLAVARGSCESPVFLELSYCGGQGPPILLAAKGVTADSGGLCGREGGCAGSVAGAAAGVGALRAAALCKLPINIVCVIPLCENMVGGQCVKVGDVVPALNGLHIQIEHTELVGRLLLADALVYGQHKHKPRLVVDIATLTRGVESGLGAGAFGCFSNSDPCWRLVEAAGARTGDRPWRLPLWDYYQDQLTDDPSVDLRNKGSGHAGPCLGAAFLKNFICGPWLHLDTSGVCRHPNSGGGGCRTPSYLPGSLCSGRPTRTIACMLKMLAVQNLKE